MAALLPFAVFKKVDLGMGQLASEAQVSTGSAVRTLLTGNDPDCGEVPMIEDSQKRLPIDERRGWTRAKGARVEEHAHAP